MARSARAHARSSERLAAALAMIAGFIDAYGFITYGVYVSFMSGNTTQTGYLVVARPLPPPRFLRWQFCSSLADRSLEPYWRTLRGALANGWCSARSQPR